MAVGILLLSVVAVSAAAGDNATFNAHDPVQERTMENTAVQSGFQVFPGQHKVAGRNLEVEWIGSGMKKQERVRLISGNVSAESKLVIVPTTKQGQSELRVSLSNGRNAELKVMPDTASNVALERLRLRVCTPERNCTMELKEVGQGNGTRLAYQMKAERSSRVFGLFRARMNVESEVDAETGELISVKKPWWAFLAREAEE